MKPVLQALVLAERIYTDTPSGKKIIAGTFNQILLAQIPRDQVELPDGSKGEIVPGGTDPGCPAVYVSLTDVVDGTEISLQFINVSKNRTIFTAPLKIKSKNRLATIEIIVPLPPIARIANETGTFSLDVVWNNEILGSHRLLIRRIDQTNRGNEK